MNFSYLSLDDQAKLSALLSQPHRTYHNMMHVYDSLTEMEQWLDAQLMESADYDTQLRGMVTYFIWYHDAVYNPYAPGLNERESADLFCAQYKNQVNLRFETESSWFYNVRDGILATSYHTTDQFERNAYVKAMLDIDLSGLGKSYGIYDRNGRNIEKEYWNTQKIDFIKARMSFLKAMLARKAIYYTPYFFDRYEKQARANMGCELEYLEEELHG